MMMLKEILLTALQAPACCGHTPEGTMELVGTPLLSLMVSGINVEKTDVVRGAETFSFNSKSP